MTLMRIEPACTLCGSMKVALFLVLEIIEPCTNIIAQRYSGNAKI